MKRKYTDTQVKQIKELLSKGYKSVSIRDIFMDKYGLKLTKADVQGIKQLSAYRDVEPQLNEKIATNLNSTFSSEVKKLIGEVKFAIANGYSDKEIQQVYKIADGFFRKIKYLQGRTMFISQEYNNAIKDSVQRKKVNIDKRMVTSIKSQYVYSSGEISLGEIADKHGIDKGTVSRIINLKVYRNFGQKFNPQIINIEKLKNQQKRIAEMVNRKKEEKKKKIKELTDMKMKIEADIKIIRAA